MNGSGNGNQNHEYYAKKLEEVGSRPLDGLTVAEIAGLLREYSRYERLVADADAYARAPHPVRAQSQPSPAPPLLSHDEPVEEGNAIVLGVTLPCVSYQKDEFGASQVITARAPFLNERIGLYVATVIEKQLYRFSYTHKPGIKVYSDLELPLPVMTVMMPDWAMLETLLKVHGGCRYE